MPAQFVNDLLQQEMLENPFSSILKRVITLKEIKYEWKNQSTNVYYHMFWGTAVGHLFQMRYILYIGTRDRVWMSVYFSPKSALSGVLQILSMGSDFVTKSLVEQCFKMQVINSKYFVECRNLHLPSPVDSLKKHRNTFSKSKLFKQKQKRKKWHSFHLLIWRLEHSLEEWRHKV